MCIAGGIPQGSALSLFLYVLVHVNEMHLQVRHGCLLQFADNTCPTCSGSTTGIMSQAL